MSYDIFPRATEEEFVRSAVSFLQEGIKSGIKTNGSYMLGLSGGSTPKKIYEELGKEDIDWSKVWIFLLDERHIESSSSDSNTHLIRETLLKNATIPESQQIFPKTDLPIDECITDYAKELHRMLDETGRLPDIVILGMGEDGHIASLFPPLNDTALGDEQLVLHTTTDQFAVKDRISVSLNFIASSQEHVFLLKGDGKKKVWEEMMKSSEDESRWPAKRVLESGPTTVIAQWEM